MPEKSVRWADTNELFYYTSPNHSPISSSSGSPGPMTPPPVQPNVLSLNESLRFKRNLGYELDLSKDPREGNLGAVMSNDSATIPQLAHIRILSSQLPFSVHIGEPKQGMGITMGDLLYRLHLALREKASEAELDKEEPEKKKAILKAFKARCEKLKERNVGTSVQEEKAGPRKIDYLQGRHIFAGFEILPPRDLPTLRLHVR
ncbi:hypothetical protein GYMLUDRAFT_48315 [Collybiopsis luxurians FD-317 M1]|uniref:DUF6699 domain-containing protein n=1 Tax=Collybiopsis luxurians FD-317 M1 TaxID=944289 RepID=A0A0D0CIY4_9AGAR|nr:hypothetical protein GYMLUDRAFT_48315 [Collybiopsis luxurians FD-317 M1]